MEMKTDDKLAIKGLANQYGFRLILKYLIELARERAVDRAQEGMFTSERYWNTLSHMLVSICEYIEIKATNYDFGGNDDETRD